MPAFRFPTLLWQDAAGFYTAVPVPAVERDAAGFGPSAALALEQLRDYLTWLNQRGSWQTSPDLHDAQLATVKVTVRPEYHTRDRIYASEQVLLLPVHCVSGRLSSGLLVAALPLLDVRFYYHDPAALKGLVVRYTQQALKGLSPGELTAFLPPPVVRLEEVVVRTRQKVRAALPQAELPNLVQVAEPLGERAVRKQYAPAWEREELLNEAVRKLHEERTNLLLVGEPGVGKSTLLVAAVQMVERLHAAQDKRSGKASGTPRLFWLTSAGRLIAGMKYLGQWEERCERVVEELAGVPGMLCVDRLLDLVSTGGTGPGDSVAAFLMPYLQRGELRLVGECTAAELEACRRLLPGFADLLPILHLPPFDRSQALAVLDRSAAEHTQNLRLQVAPEVSGRVYHLFRRFAPYQVFPGLAVRFLREVCERHARQEQERPLTAEDVVEGFTRRTGLPRWLLRDEVLLDRPQLLEEFRRQVIGQEEAVRAAVQLVTTFKAGLNDPNRPLGVLLFCGPTGVGKTELARALVRVLFGHGGRDDSRQAEERLVRLDMSEYAGFGAVERLLGPPHGEPGALIRRLRQQPFCVLLLDEIEKAAPEVFDVLLGVCDEGRLTDRFGRTTTFRSSVIVLTSNLGAERSALGFGRTGPPPYADAVRAFFRPEFFNRLDAVVTFQPLQPDTVLAITHKELGEIARREGLRRADLQLGWSEVLAERLAKEGFDPRYGARPLQRLLERRVVAPLAEYLLAHPGLRDARLSLDCDDQGEVRVSCETFQG